MTLRMRKGGIGSFVDTTPKELAGVIAASTAHLSETGRAAARDDLIRQAREQGIDVDGYEQALKRISRLQKALPFVNEDDDQKLAKLRESLAEAEAAERDVAATIVEQLRQLPNEDRNAVIGGLFQLSGDEQTGRAMFKSHKIGGGSELRAPAELAEELRGLTAKQTAELLEAVGKKYGWRERNVTSDREYEAMRADLERAANVMRTANDHLRPTMDAAFPTFTRIAREWAAPTGRPKTPANFELLAMNCIRATIAIERESQVRFGDEWQKEADATGIEWLTVQHLAAEKNDGYRRVLDALCDFWNEFDDCPGFGSFCEEWIKTAYARLEIGHKLAAALCLTDVPEDIEVRAPWPAWSLVIPDGLFGPHLNVIATGGGPSAPIARVWCVGTEPRFAICIDGVFGVINRANPKIDPIAFQMLDSLIRGACLALSNPEEFNKERVGPHRPGSSSKSDKRKAPPDLQQARFLLSAPVKVDFRQEILDSLSGKRKSGGGTLTVQFKVRGHWKQQAHGPKHSLRKQIWIQPFWKGPEESRVLLRSYKVAE